MPSAAIAPRCANGSGGSNSITSLLSTPSGTVTIARSTVSDSPVPRRRLTDASVYATRVTTLE